MEIKCKKCKYEWNYKGKYNDAPVDYPMYVTCPKCLSKIRIPGGKA